MVATVEELAHADATFDKESADTLGCVKLVAREREQVKLERPYVNGNLADGLHRVGVEVDVGFRGDTANVRERLDGAEFVVGMHNGNERGFGANGLAQIVKINEAVAVYREIGDGDTLFFESLTGVEDRFVFDGGSDDVLGGAGRSGGVDHTEDCVIVRLGASTGEDNFLRASVQKSGDLFAGCFDGGASALAESVDGGGVAKISGEKGKHGVEDRGVDGSGGVMVEIDTMHRNT